MTLFTWLSQTVPLYDGTTETLFINVVIFLFLVMVIAFFSWIIREISNLGKGIEQNQRMILTKLETNETKSNEKVDQIQRQMVEYEKFNESISLKLSLISEQIPDYGIVFRKFTEVDEKIHEHDHKFKRYDYHLDQLTKAVDKVKHKE